MPEHMRGYMPEASCTGNLIANVSEMRFTYRISVVLADNIVVWSVRGANVQDTKHALYFRNKR